MISSIAFQPAIMRQVHKVTVPYSRSRNNFITDPRSGREFRMQLIEFARMS
jgi:hypothetical protein